MSKDSYCIFRPELDSFPDISLPVYPRSCGYVCRGKGQWEFVPAGEKNFVQIFWTISGEGEFFINGSWQTSRSGDVTFRLPMEEHSFRAVSDEWIYRWIVFDGTHAADFMKSFGYPNGIFHAGSCPEEMFTAFESRMKLRTPYCWRMMYADLCGIIASMGGMANEESQEDRIVVKITDLCRDNYKEPDFNVNNISEQLGIGRGTLSAIFQKKMNLTLSAYLVQVRLQAALSLLKSSADPLKSVALQCGFRDVNYFCRFIRRQTGRRPSQLR